MRVIAPLVVLAALLATASPAAAATFTVTTTADSTNPCSGTSCPSIRSALAAAEAAGGADTVIVPAGNYQLSQAGALLVDSDVTLRGASARTTTVVAGLGARVFEVGTSVSVTIAQVTASGGTGASGGNVLNQGALTLDHVRVTGGNATGAGGSGVANESGSLTVRNSLIDANRGSGQGGGILSTGTTLAPARLTVTDSTVYDNNATHQPRQIDVAVRLISARGSDVFNAADSMSTTAAPSNIFAQFKLEDLAPGSYLLRVEAKVNGSADAPVARETLITIGQ